MFVNEQEYAKLPIAPVKSEVISFETNFQIIKVYSGMLFNINNTCPLGSTPGRCH